MERPICPYHINKKDGAVLMRGRRDIRKKIQPRPVSELISRQFQIKLNNDTFRCYEDVCNEGPICIFVHGGGFGAATFLPLIVQMKKLFKFHPFAYDLRGHGDTFTEDDDKPNLLMEILVNDTKSIIEHHFFNTDQYLNRKFVLIGHSLGGAIITHLFNDCEMSWKNQISAVIVIDAIEGIAMNALSSMPQILKNRPNHFTSVPSAIRYMYESNQIKSLSSAVYTVPSQIKRIGQHHSMVMELVNNDYIEEIESDLQSFSINNNFPSIAEEENENINFQKQMFQEQQKKKQLESMSKYEWRIDLIKTEKSWSSWFANLSDLFINLPTNKILYMNNVDELDKKLTIAHMQGKFEVGIIPKAGHAIQEDNPTGLATDLQRFLQKRQIIPGWKSTLPPGVRLNS
ncbi:hypothetical protein SNEBB_003548 [Seison nebaliae]|nr:hypothetical protein SNEBB_003548 [Seison nebaliae]